MNYGITGPYRTRRYGWKFQVLEVLAIGSVVVASVYAVLRLVRG